MKTRTAACFAALLVVSLAAPGRAALKLSFKLGGGAAMLLGGAGDIERFREGERALADSWARDDFRTATFDWRKLSAVPELGGEVIIHVTPKIGLGLGVGYLEARAKAGYGTNASESWTLPWGTFLETESYAVERDIRLSAIPVTLNLHLRAPLSSRFAFTAQAGVGAYFGRLRHVCDVKSSSFYGYESDDYYDQKSYYDETAKTTEEATCRTVGFQGGLGLEWMMTKSLSLGLELAGRFVDFKRFRGDSSIATTSRERFWHEALGWWYDETSSGAGGERGDLYYWEWHSNDYGRDYGTMGIRADAPARGGVRGVRRAAVDMNRVGLLVTVGFRFGQ